LRESVMSRHAPELVWSKGNLSVGYDNAFGGNWFAPRSREL